MAEKLTETFGLKVSETQLRLMQGIAEHHGLPPSEWVRGLIDAAIREEMERYKALHSVFGHVEL